MYKKHSIAKLSPAQISKLLNGHAVRIKHGNHHEIHLSVEQAKKAHRAHTKGKAVQIRFDPYQMQNHQHLRGKGSVRDEMAKFYDEKIPQPFHSGLESLGNAAIHELGFGLKKRGRPRKMRGGNIFDDWGNQINNSFRNTFTPELGRKIAKGAIDYGIPAVVGGLTTLSGNPEFAPLTSFAAKQFTGDIDRAVGLGLRRRGRPRKARGGSIKDDMANFYDQKIPQPFHAGLESLGNAAIHELGFGLKKRGRPRKAHGGSLLGKTAKAILKPMAKQVAHQVVKYGAAAAGPAAAAAATMAGAPEFAPMAAIAGNYIAREKAATAHKYIDGLGLKKRGRPKKHGGALMAAGY